jgi:diguanylate cyclase (GGDEF)-like protein
VAGLGATGGASGDGSTDTHGNGVIAVPLSPGFTAVSGGSLTGGAGGTGGSHPGGSRTGIQPRPVAVKPVAVHTQTVIQRIERVIPEAVWIALGLALAVAMVAASAAVWSGRQVRRQADRFAAVAAAAMTDPLTGVLNRRGFVEAAERELARARRYGRPFVMAYVDIRGLKAVNDTEGHLAGDELLKEVARILRESARADDVVGRIGGDELALLLAEQTTTGALPVLDRIGSQVAIRRAELALHAPWDLTIGTASYPGDGDSIHNLLASADRRLYQQRGIALS